MKKCSKCHNEKENIEFYKNKRYKDNLSSWCKICQIQYNQQPRRKYHRKQYEIKNLDYVKNTRHECHNRYYKTLNARFKKWKTGAKLRNIPFNLTLDHLKTLPMMCYYTGIPLTLEPHNHNTVSLDRIDSNKGYDKNNICFCMWCINNIKRSYTVDHLISMSRSLLIHKGYKIIDPNDNKSITNNI
jgi:hypothetical protein